MGDIDFDSHSKNDEITQKMAGLLLKGWTMLSDNCTRCTEVPLMRSRDGSSVCCKCSARTPSNVRDKRNEFSYPDEVNTSRLDPYVPIGELNLNGIELNSIHSGNDKLVPNGVKPVENMLQRQNFNFELGQLRLLEVQVNKLLYRYLRYSNMLNSGDRTVDLDL
ncbi:uncharacterized protein TOT_040000829 [Theileria orientalis strain Shintoku]|uniref:Uncharacterized protein n=1 Tax=Theileria orientalis strain Shintoku TaxID=869250 RepID=J7MCE5_THEOR|nr:uncharacterized protein TOT_040000829 [Theileria orientalis strain Shintoku]BAM42462.1 uncharacterized protein TOT_040000829 [Theileria orientalis strain Shintoku]|eukprot:XP_009692763.1 uncharacterized protein TOT_040000829 [Theileria orientalis strain Shintoku]